MGAVECAIQTLNNLIIANLEDKIGFTERINRALRVMPFTIHIGLRVSQIELHHGRKPRPDLTNKVQDNKKYPSDSATLHVSLPPKQIPFYVARYEKGEVTDHIVMARKRSFSLLVSQVTEEAGKAG